MKIQFLSNMELLSRFGKLVQTERKISHLVLECIAEIDSRRLYLDRAYPSLYEFLVKEFGYSSSAALRRIESARLLREVPEVAQKIEAGALNLSQLTQVQQAIRTVQKLEDRKLDVEEKKEILKRIEYSTQKQTEVILSQTLSLPIQPEEKERVHRDESVTLTMTFSKEQMEILNQVQDLISHAIPEKKWVEVITYLAQKEIQRRTKVRGCKKVAEISTPQVKAKGNPPTHSLSMTAKKLNLDKHRYCQFKDPKTGKVCGTTRFLQHDHRHPVWAGGTNDIANLQILCAVHNQHKYRQESSVRLKSF